MMSITTRCRHLVYGVMSVVFIGVSNAEQAPQRPAESPEIQTLIKLNKESVDLQLGKQWPKFDGLLVQSFIMVGTDGKLSDKKAFLDELNSGKRVFDSYEQIDEPVVELYGQAAVISSKYRISGVVNGTQFAGLFRITKMLVKKNNKWQITCWIANTSNSL